LRRISDIWNLNLFAQGHEGRHQVVAVFTRVLGVHAGKSIHPDAGAVFMMGRKRQQLDAGPGQGFLPLGRQGAKGIEEEGFVGHQHFNLPNG
jgi:hypothetical protein